MGMDCRVKPGNDVGVIAIAGHHGSIAGASGAWQTASMR
jgi:hypothetical protein